MAGVAEPVRSFADWLKQLRNQAGAPAYAEIVRRVKETDPTSSLAQSTVSETFSAKRLPRYETASAVARALGGPSAAQQCHDRWIAAKNHLDALTGSPDPSGPSVEANELEQALHGSGEPALSNDEALQATGTSVGKTRRAPRPWMLAAAIAVLGVATGVLVWRAFPTASTASPRTSASASPSESAGNDPSVGSGPAGIVAIQGSWEPACPLVYLPGGPAQQALASSPPFSVDYHAARDVQSGTVQITAQANTDEDVLLTGIKVINLQRAPAPTSGIFVASGECGGGVTPRTFSVDLDATPAKVVGVTAWNFNEEIPATNFPYKISRHDPELFNLVPTTSSCDCRFSYEVDWVVHGQPGKTVVDNDGHSFRVVPDTVRIPEYYNQESGPDRGMQPRGVHQPGS